MVRAETNVKTLFVGFVAVILAYMLVERFQPAEYVEATAVLSPCGIYAIVALDNKGKMTVFDGKNALPVEIAETLLQLEKEKRHTVLVPCLPPVQNNGQIQA